MKNYKDRKLSVEYPLPKPILFIEDPMLLEKIRYFVAKAPKECQWFHEVERITCNDKGEQVWYLLKNMYIPEQEVSASSVDTSEEMMISLSQEIQSKVKEALPDDEKDDIVRLCEESNKIEQALNCWCHSHVNMSPTPSNTDKETFAERIQDNIAADNDREQLMLIFNKKGEIYSKIYDPLISNDGPIIFEYVDIRVGSWEFDDIDDAFENRIKEKKYNHKGKSTTQYPHNTSRHYGHGSYGGHHSSKGSKQSHTRWLIQEALHTKPLSDFVDKISNVYENILSDIDIDKSIEQLLGLTKDALGDYAFAWLPIFLYGTAEDLEKTDLNIVKSNDVKAGRKLLKEFLKDETPTLAAWLSACQACYRTNALSGDKTAEFIYARLVEEVESTNYFHEFLDPEYKAPTL